MNHVIRQIIANAIIFGISSTLGLSATAQVVDRAIVFPVIGPVTYYNDYGQQRAGHLHIGNDLVGQKLFPLVSAVDGIVTSINLPEESWGYSVTIRDRDGYSYHYLHINNDTPGSDDHLGGPMFAYAPDIGVGREVVRGQLIGWMGDSGNAETAAPHLHFELHEPNRAPYSPYTSLKSAVKLNIPVPAPQLDDETLPYGNYVLSSSIAAGNFDNDDDVEFVTGAGKGGGPHVRIIDEVGDNRALGEFYAYVAGFLGGVDVAAGDIDGDGIDEIITGAGPGGGPHVKIFRVNGTQFNAGFFAYDSKFTGGVQVASADLDGDGHAEIITGPGPGGGPHIKVFNADGTQFNAGFFAYDSKFTGGVDVSAGPARRGQEGFIVTGPGPGGGPNVKVFDVDGKLQEDFFAYDSTFMGGLRVSVGNFRTRDSGYEIAVAPASNHEPEFKLFDQDGDERGEEGNVFDRWWIGSYDIAIGHGIAFGIVGGPGGPVGRRASVRELNF